MKEDGKKERKKERRKKENTFSSLRFQIPGEFSRAFLSGKTQFNIVLFLVVVVIVVVLFLPQKGKCTFFPPEPYLTNDTSLCLFLNDRK